MIDCPICHVMNEDMARFCAECGQRLTAPSAPPTASPPNTPQATVTPGKQPSDSSPTSTVKLNSPLLGGEPPSFSPAAPESKQPKPDFSRLRNSGKGAPVDASGIVGTGGARGLRSPLLGNDNPTIDESEPSPPTKKRGLHSPLLSGGAGEVDYDSSLGAHSPSRGSAGSQLRSPLLDGSENDFDERPVPRSGSGLRSPLLGSGEVIDDEPSTHTGPRQSGVGRAGGLRSPLLAGAESPRYDERIDYQEPTVEDDPNVLRSPLLAAKVPMPEKVQPVKPAPSLNPSPLSDANYVTDNASATQGKQESSKRAEPTFPSEQRIENNPPADSYGNRYMAESSFAASTSNAASDRLSGYPTQSPSITQQGSPTEHPGQQLQGKDTPYQTMLDVGSRQGQVKPPNLDASPSQTSLDFGKTKIGSTNARAQGFRLLESETEIMPAAPKKRLQSRMLAEDEVNEVEHSSYMSDKAYSKSSGQESPLGKILAFFLILAAGIKIWSLVELQNKSQLLQPYLLDQLGSLVVIVCLIIICLTNLSLRR